MPLDLFASPAAGPLLPADYLRLRRQAAGLTISQVATAFFHREEHRADVEANLRTFETPGVKVKQHIADTLPRAFPFDPDIYRQLCDEPPHRHPTVCRSCGCTDSAPCTTRDGFECTIGEDDVCNACIENAQRKALRRAA